MDQGSPSFLPNWLCPQFSNQPIEAAGFSWSGTQEDQEPSRPRFCLGYALREYPEVTSKFHNSYNLFICHAECKKGTPLTKQRLSHWVVEVIENTHGTWGLPIPRGIKSLSTRGMAALKGVSP